VDYRDNEKKDRPTLTEDAISSKRVLTRRSMLGTLGIAAGAAAATVFGSSAAFAADGPGRSRTCPYRDSDMMTRRGDTVRVRANCGITDNDTSDATGRSRRCNLVFRDRDTTRQVARDTIRRPCGRTDRD
jgi:hypothetical protein